MDILYNIRRKSDSKLSINSNINVVNIIITSKAGQRLVITENKDGEFNIKIE